jgi:hypothetical protein
MWLPMHFLVGMPYSPRLDAKLLGFEYIKELYAEDHEFREEYRACKKIASGKFFRLDGFLFRENKLCVPNCSMRELLVQESHGGGLMGHFGVAKTLAIFTRPLLFASYETRCRTDLW